MSLLQVVPAGTTAGTDRSLVPRTCGALASHNSTRDINSSDAKNLITYIGPSPKNVFRALKIKEKINRFFSFVLISDQKESD